MRVLQQAANIAQVLSLPPGAYCAYAAWVALHAQQQQTSAPVTPSALLIAAFGAFVGLLALAAVLTALAWKVRARPSPTDDPMGILASYYMLLTLLREHVQQMIETEQLGDQPLSLNYYPLEAALARMRRELMNLSPSVFPMSTALDFQAPSPRDGYVDPKVRLPAAIDELRANVLKHWHRLGGPVKTG